ncbi:IS1/IS1595 family N-terminal zinc-binding domain-containing protein [Desulfovibrio sp. SGI.169]|uniref:IS1/IS1595 family N-terminal zinc-binding domain-containing protein n=1 Tax=Desulfovibrio sp. SGI.169 TaxID=3420561 RepID=UPI003D0316B4
MTACKNCGLERIVKNGFARRKPRCRCKECGFNFVEMDDRKSDAVAAEKAMIILMD